MILQSEKETASKQTYGTLAQILNVKPESDASTSNKDQTVEILILLKKILKKPTSIIAKLNDLIEIEAFKTSQKLARNQQRKISVIYKRAMADLMIAAKDSLRQQLIELYTLIVEPSSKQEFNQKINLETQNEKLNQEAKLIFNAMYDLVKNEKAYEENVELYQGIQDIFNFLPKTPSKETYLNFRNSVIEQIQKLIKDSTKSNEELLLDAAEELRQLKL